MTILVCGGRRFADWTLLLDTLDGLHAKTPVTKLVHGAAQGADAMADYWGLLSGVPTIGVPADWKKYGKGAGPIRNAEMLKRYSPQLVVAFPGGPGTAHMIKIARAAGVEVLEVGRPRR